MTFASHAAHAVAQYLILVTAIQKEKREERRKEYRNI